MQVVTLKQVIATVIVSLIEETPPDASKTDAVVSGKAAHAHAGVSQEVIDALDPESIWQVALDSYTQCVVSLHNTFCVLKSLVSARM